MKKLCKIAAIILSIVSVFTLASCSAKKTTSASKLSIKSVSDETWKNYTDGKIELSNEKFILSMDVKTAHFTVSDLKNSITWYSSLYDNVDENAENLSDCSELIIGYYDKSSRKNEMNSMLHSLSFGEIKVLSDKNKIRVYYTLRLEKSAPFVMEVLTADMYEKISNELESTDKFKFKLMYNYYPVSNKTVNAEDVRAKYSYAKKNDIYILKPSTSASDKESLSAWVETAGYDEGKYLAQLAEAGIELDNKDIPVSFCVPVEYTLTENGFTACLLTDKITTANEEFVLQSVSLLPYFNSSGVGTFDGFMLVPDATGALIDTTISDDAVYSQRIYGDDYAIARDYTADSPKSALMPVFGLSSEKGSFFSFVESGDEFAYINAARHGKTNRCPHIYSEFSIRAVDDYETRKSRENLSILSKDVISVNPTVNYVLTEPNTNALSMADMYRDYLIENSLIKENKNADKTNVYLEFTGYVTVETTFLGIPYEKKIVLSKLSSVIDSVNRLIDKGVKNIYIRLSSFSNGGKYHSLENSFDIYSGVGTVEELKELSKILKANGGALYLENDVFEVYKDTSFDGFRSSADAIRRLDTTQCYINDNDIVSLQSKSANNTRYLISPAKYPVFAQDFITSFNKRFNNTDIYISSKNIGKYLFSDFSAENYSDRAVSKVNVLKTAEKYSKSGSFMTDCGNMYSLKSAEHILSVPLRHSNYKAEALSIPFYEAATYGCVSLSSEAINLSDNPEQTQLQALITGVNPYWSLITETDDISLLNSFQEMLPTDFNDSFDEIISFTEDNKQLYQLHRSCKMKSVKLEQNGLIIVEFENAKSVVFNTTEKSITFNQEDLAAGKYIILEGK